jgi:peptidoglycan/LPS O-acetylase OafA/YrhL
MSYSYDTITEEYKKGLRETVDGMKELCASSRSLGCYFTTNSYDQNQRDVVSPLVGAHNREMRERATEGMYMLDVYDLGSALPGEVIEAHMTPILHHWVGQMMLNVICSLQKRESYTPPSAVVDSTCVPFSANRPVCSSAHVSRDLKACPTYRDNCRRGQKFGNDGGCFTWMCPYMTDCAIEVFQWSDDNPLDENPHPGGAETVATTVCTAASDFSMLHTVKQAYIQPSCVETRNVFCGDPIYLILISVGAALLVLAYDVVLAQRAKRKNKAAPTPNEEYHVDAGAGSAEPKVPEGRRSLFFALTASPSYRFGKWLPFGLARYVASCLIVVGHLHAKGALPNTSYFASWGFTWVPFFFLLSGFVLMHARQQKDSSYRPNVLQFFKSRLRSVYPLYAVGLLVAFVMAKMTDTCPDWHVIAAQALLLQSFFPTITELALQSHCWFLSALVLYWALFECIYTYLGKLDRKLCYGLALLCVSVPWMAVIVPAASPHLEFNWYNEHAWGDTTSMTDDQVDWAVVFLKFHPLCYFHVFVFGMTLSRIRQLVSTDNTAASVVLDIATPMGYIGLFLVFSIKAIQPPSWKLSTRLSILLPLQGLVLYGLSGIDNWSKGRELRTFLSLRWAFIKLDWLGRYSYPQYIVQFICYNLWPTQTVDWTFWIFLTATAIVFEAMDRHLQKSVFFRDSILFGAILFFGVFITALSRVPSTDVSFDPYSLPSSFRHSHSSIDIRLALNRITSKTSDVGVIINPSLTFIDNGDDIELILAGREHGIQVKQVQDTYNGQTVTRIDQTWHSAVFIGTKSFKADVLHQWPNKDKGYPDDEELRMDVYPAELLTSDGSKWDKLCTRDTYIPENKTLIRIIVTGPEDPRLTLVHGKPVLSFNSILPDGGMCPEPVVSQSKNANFVTFCFQFLRKIDFSLLFVGVCVCVCVCVEPKSPHLVYSVYNSIRHPDGNV